MTKGVWINLPVKNIEASKIFFKQIGFEFNEQFGGDASISACMLVGNKKVVFMLFQEAIFKHFTQQPLADTAKTAELLISFDAESIEEIDAIAKNVEQAGGVLFTKPASLQGWMYGCGFCDLDGHRWNALYMDFSKLPQ